MENPNNIQLMKMDKLLSTGWFQERIGA